MKGSKVFRWLSDSQGPQSTPNHHNHPQPLTYLTFSPPVLRRVVQALSQSRLYGHSSTGPPKGQHHAGSTGPLSDALQRKVGD